VTRAGGNPLARRPAMQPTTGVFRVSKKRGAAQNQICTGVHRARIARNRASAVLTLPGCLRGHSGDSGNSEVRAFATVWRRHG
jgi:hypothetical protein